MKPHRHHVKNINNNEDDDDDDDDGKTMYKVYNIII